MTEMVRITVGEDGARGLVRLSRRTIQQLGLTPGDLVELEGARKSYGRVVPAAVPEATAQIDAHLARNAEIAPNAEVALMRTELPTLDTVVVKIDGAGPVSHEDLKDALFDMALKQDDALSVRLRLGRDIGLTIVSVSPADAGVLRETTTLTIEAAPDPAYSYDGVGGMAEQIAHVHEMIAAPLLRPDLYDRLGISAPRGVLFSGPPGSGKTLLARAVAGKTKAAFFHINGPEIVTKHYGESEAALRKTFAAAEKSAPAIIFIDEIDAIAPARADLSSEKQVERRVVAQLLTLMDGLADRGRIVVMAATNLPDSLDPALRRPGRFDREIAFRAPTAAQREEILCVHLANSPLAGDVNLTEIAAQTHGYVGADLAALAREAAVAALSRTVADAGGEANVRADDLFIAQADLRHGLSVTNPSALRSAGSDSAPVPWDSVGGLDAAKEHLTEAVIWPMKNRALYDKFAVTPPRGILLSGPPGTGKTLLARALATQTGMNFVPVRPPRLLSEFFGAAERAVADIFATARMSAPTLLFFDEFDSLAPRRSGKDPVLDRIVAQLLMELDGMEDNRDVVVIAATNRPDAIDPALTRPGRFDTVIEIPPPDTAARAAILSVHLTHRPVALDVNIGAFAEQTDGMTGADLATLVRDAARIAVARQIVGSNGKSRDEISAEDLHLAITRLARSAQARRKDFVAKEGVP